MIKTAYIENRKLKIGGLGLAIVYSLLSLFAVPAYAAFEDTGTGARPTALGGAYVAAGDDVQSLMYNPAGLAKLNQKELTSEYSKLYAGLSDGSNLSQYFMGYGQPVRWGGTMALGIKQFSLDDLYKERIISLGYGEWLTSDIAIGGALKQLYHSFGAPNIIVDDSGNVQAGRPSFFAQNGNSQTAYSADLGMLYKWSDRQTIGASIQDINEPNVALSPSDHEPVNRTLRLGTTYRVKKDYNLMAAVTSKESLEGQRDNTFTGAAERWWTLHDGDAVALRGSLASGSREFRQATVGGGYRFGSFQVDYAFVFNLSGLTLGDTAGTHRFSLGYRWGGRPPPKPRLPDGPRSRGRSQPNRSADIDMVQGYEFPQTGQAPAVSRQQVPLPREVEITITPEEIDTTPAPVKSADISVSVVFDSDYDGVPDEDDRCAGTPAGWRVDAAGCTIDSDGDGIEDYMDQCPKAGRRGAITTNGCPYPRRVTIEFQP